MLHSFFSLTRPLIMLDTETTGLTSDARIIELGFQQWVGPSPCKICGAQYEALKGGLIAEVPLCDACHGTGFSEGGLAKEWRSLIDPQSPIPEAASAIHHITDAMIKACQTCGGELQRLDGNVLCACEKPKIAPTFRQLSASLARGFSDCDFAGKNVRFDLRRLTYEFSLCGVAWSYTGARIIDIDRLEAIAIPRNLDVLHEKYLGHKHDGAHGALSDVQASTRVMMAQLETHGEKLPRDLDQLHALQWPGWLTADGSIKLVNGIPTMTFGKYREKSMHEVSGSYWDFILKGDFPPDVKKLASEAKLGRFPQPTAEQTAAADKRMEV